MYFIPFHFILFPDAIFVRVQALSHRRVREILMSHPNGGGSGAIVERGCGVVMVIVGVIVDRGLWEDG